MIVPITGRLTALRFAHTLKITPSPTNGLTIPSVLLVFQLRAIARSRLLQRLGHLEDSHLQAVSEEMRNLLDL
jgi:mRNA interferase MazF